MSKLYAVIRIKNKLDSNDGYNDFNDVNDNEYKCYISILYGDMLVAEHKIIIITTDIVKLFIDLFDYVNTYNRKIENNDRKVQRIRIYITDEYGYHHLSYPTHNSNKLIPFSIMLQLLKKVKNTLYDFNQINKIIYIYFDFNFHIHIDQLNNLNQLNNLTDLNCSNDLNDLGGNNFDLPLSPINCYNKLIQCRFIFDLYDLSYFNYINDLGQLNNLTDNKIINIMNNIITLQDFLCALDNHFPYLKTGNYEIHNREAEREIEIINNDITKCEITNTYNYNNGSDSVYFDYILYEKQCKITVDYYGNIHLLKTIRSLNYKQICDKITFAGVNYNRISTLFNKFTQICLYKNIFPNLSKLIFKPKIHENYNIVVIGFKQYINNIIKYAYLLINNGIPRELFYIVHFYMKKIMLQN